MTTNPPIRALLLAAGFGTRLRPLTNHTPKCLVEVCGQPLLQHWFDKLTEINCEKALVNTHYLSEQVHSYVAKYANTSMDIECSYEHELLGTAGTFLKHLDFFSGSYGVLIHADNFMVDSLHQLIHSHLNRVPDTKFTMLIKLIFPPP